MPILGIKTTKAHLKFWKDRKIDWEKSYLSTWNHPHRDLIVMALKGLSWYSLWEVGCGPGANLVRIVKDIPNKQLGGCDVNEDAIALARKTFNGGRFHVESSEDMLLSDRAVDIVLSDASLIYIGPTKIKKVLGEMKRIGRNQLLLCELHEPKWWKRWIYRFKTGYNVYDYKKLLEGMGCYKVGVFKIPKEYWPGTPWETYGHIIIAHLPK